MSTSQIVFLVLAVLIFGGALPFDAWRHRRAMERRRLSKIRRDEAGEPITCDCPDGPSRPCDGTGWCT